MSGITLESLAARLTEVERKLSADKASEPTPKDWRGLVGMFDDNDFTRQWIAEMEAIRELDRTSARESSPEAGA